MMPSHAEWEQVACPSCGGRKWAPGSPAWRAGERSSYAVRMCAHCGLRRLDSLLDAESGSGHYGPGYYAQAPADKGIKSSLKRLLEDAPGWLPEALTSAVSINLVPDPPHPGARLLDVGCGGGSYLERAQARGWSVAGTEYSDLTARAARRLGYEVFAGEWERDLPPSAFDLVVANHVLEHVPGPSELLRTIATALRPGGLVRIGLPDFGCAQSKAFGGAWWANLPPEHVWFFERRHVDMMVRSAGLRPVRVLDLSRPASQLGPAVWQAQWATWRTAGGDGRGFAVRAMRSVSAAVVRPRGDGLSGGAATMYTLTCSR